MMPYRAKVDVASIKLLHALDYARAQVSCPRKEGMHIEGVRSFPGLAIHLDPLTLKSREPLKDTSTIFTEFALTGLSLVVSSSRLCHSASCVVCRYLATNLIRCVLIP